MAKTTASVGVRQCRVRAPSQAARVAHDKVRAHLNRCPALLRAQLCERCCDLEANAMRLAFRAELLSARGEALVALRAGATGR